METPCGCATPTQRDHLGGVTPIERYGAALTCRADALLRGMVRTHCQGVDPFGLDGCNGCIEGNGQTARLNGASHDETAAGGGAMAALRQLHGLNMWHSITTEVRTAEIIYLPQFA